MHFSIKDRVAKNKILIILIREDKRDVRTSLHLNTSIITERDARGPHTRDERIRHIWHKYTDSIRARDTQIPCLHTCIQILDNADRDLQA